MGALLHTMMALFILWGLAVVLLDFASHRYRSTFIEKSFVWVSICGALAMVAVFIAIVPALLDSVGDRRDISAQETKGLMYLLSWIALLSYCYIRGYLRGTQNSWFWSVAGMMLFALLSEILGAAAFRYVAVILPLFLAALLHVESKKMALYIVLCCFNAMLFVPWVDWGI
jgi:hypothetical protein